MPIPYEEAEHIFAAPKRLLVPPGWDSGSRAGKSHSSLECRVQMDGAAIPRGVFFRIITYPEHLNSLTFQLDCERPEVRAHVELYRLELNPLRQHLNKMYGTIQISGLYFAPGETHEHDFHDSLTLEGNLRTKSCDQARPVVDPPKEFATALARVCSRINIVNGGDVPFPRTQGSFF